MAIPPLQILMAGGTGLVTLTLLSHSATGNVSGASHNFSMNCGAGGNIVLGAQIFTSGVFGTTTIGGVTATQRVLANIGAAGEKTAIYTASGVPSGTQTITLTVSGGSGVSTRWGAQLYSISGQSSLTPVSTASDISAPISVTLNVPAGGAVLGTTEAGVSSSSSTWTGITEDVDDNDGLAAICYGSASASFPGGNASLSTSVTPNSGTAVGAWAVWGPL